MRERLRCTRHSATEFLNTTEPKLLGGGGPRVTP